MTDIKGQNAWEPPPEVSREEILATSPVVLSLPEIKIKSREDLFRIRVLEMDWDIGSMIYEPADAALIPLGPDGKRASIFLLHGGMGDHKSMDPLARLLAGKFGYKVASMSFPGRLCITDPGRDWPGDTLNPDGTARTPIWCKDSLITPDQYEVIKDTSLREKYGTIISLMAKKGTEFYQRLAAWPVAFDEAMQEICRRHLPADQYSIYAHGHSTGGPFVMIASQRIPNMRGLLGYGTSPFGYISDRIAGKRWDFPFNYLRLRTWRDTARYTQEDLAPKGYSLPLQMEIVFERWEQGRKRANFKAEDFIHKNSTKSLAEAAQVAAERLGMPPQETSALIRRYVGYCRELSGPGVKPVPPFLSLHGIQDDTVPFAQARNSLPLYAAMDPAPKVRCVLFGAGVHSWSYSDEGLPQGVMPAVVKLWHEAIMAGYFNLLIPCIGLGEQKEV
ncbi:MAG: hypothetical protein V1758_09255 [Pseudomonadota bacterium]